MLFFPCQLVLCLVFPISFSLGGLEWSRGRTNSRLMDYVALSRLAIPERVKKSRKGERKRDREIVMLNMLCSFFGSWDMYV
ncbi:hypothetical protein M440DRAFT_1404476 [Trichoderma longibrachiatum ATCC 18648]|uniref:Secreted protein n=1 Tax=Trichoderma longibrachiatum ATCC 18648 TaxID=983965 RepID=A0A2T4BVZ2_TRILO|nr:hypothetical protein M440DRAFT_1404476 [Trichoderma longibrachiatum ATCC 18648]